MIGGNKRAKKIDYKNKKFENPFFDKRKKSSKKQKTKFTANLKIKLYIVFGIFLIAFILWVFFYSNIFSIQKIIVEGAVRTQPNEIANMARDQVEETKFIIGTQNNIFLFDEKALKNKLIDKYAFKNVKVAKEKPGTIKIEVSEKSYAYIWKEGEKYYYADIDGYIIKEINPLEIKNGNYPLIENQGNDKIYENKIIANKEKINFIEGIFSYLQEGNSYDIEIENFIVDNTENKVTLKIIGGPEIYFNSKESPDEQITKLLIIKDEKLKDDFFSKSYIDLQYGEKVYYR